MTSSRRAVLAALVALAYFVTAWTGLQLDPVAGFATLVWPPTGIALAALLLGGRSLWPSILVGALAANVIAGAPWIASLGVALGNTLEAVAGAELLRHFASPGFINRIGDVIRFLAVAAAAPVLSATVGVLSLLGAGTMSPSQAAAAWQSWWIGDVVGALLVAPLILAWANRGSLHATAARRREIALLAVALVTAGAVVFFRAAPEPPSFLEGYLVLPVLLWAAVRFEQRGATTAVAIMATIAIVGTARGTGPFAHEALRPGLLALQTFAGIVAATFLVLAVAFAERARAWTALGEALIDERALALPTQPGPLHRLLVESVTDYAIFALDASGQVLTWNPGAERLKGYTADEILGKHFSVFYPADVAATGFPQHELEVAAREGRFEDEGWRVRKDGSRFWANVVMTPLRDTSGNVIGFAKVTRDLTSRRDAEEDRRRLAAAEAAQDAAQRAERDARFLDQATAVLASSLDYELTLNRLAQLVVPELADWCVIDTRADHGGLRRIAVMHRDPARVHFAREIEAQYPTDMNAATGAPQVFRTGEAEMYTEISDALLEQGARDANHLRMLRELGLRSVMIVPIRARNRVDGVLTMVSAESGRSYGTADLDLARELGRRAGLAVENSLLLAEAKAAAERMAALQGVTARLAGIVSAGEIGDVVLREGLSALGAVHAALCATTETGEELELVASVGLPDDVVAAFQRFRVDAPLPLSEAVRSGDGLFLEGRSDIVARFPDLQEANSRATTEAWIALPLSLGTTPIGGIAFGFSQPRRFDGNDRHFAMALAHQTALAIERTRLYAAERSARAEAESANHAKSQFLATMSHELRTPLNAIGGYAELLEMGLHGALAPEQAEAVRRIRRSERRLGSLIEDVLAFARIEAGKLDLEVGPVAVRDAIVSVEQMVAPQLRAKALDFNFANLDESLVALGDADRIQQILLNLLTNAIKFTPEGGRITVVGALVGDRVEVRVKDTGIGIPENDQESIFSPFVQLGRTLSSPQQGTGLGLAISRDLARAMHGDLRVESKPGAGSTFCLTLPASR